MVHAAFRAQPVHTDPPSAALEETAATFARHLETAGGFGAWQAGRLVGVVLWSVKDGGAYLGRLAVHPACRGQGLARALIGAVEAAARQHGLPRVHMGVRLALADNRALFAACGYAEAGLTTHPGYAAPTSVVMEKRL